MLIPYQFTVKAHLGLFEGEGGEPKMRHCNSNLQLTYCVRFESVCDIHFQNAHKTLFQSTSKLTYTFKTRTKHTNTARASTLCVYFVIDGVMI